MYILAAVELPQWLNYPGLEAWKFFNLAVFVAVMIYLLRRKISDALGARRDAIKEELVQAQQQREQAMNKVIEASNLLSDVDTKIASIREHTQAEAESERARLATATEREIEKLKQQAQREIDTADKVARKQLRQFFAKRSVEVAREAIKVQMKPEDDAVLISQSISELRRTRV
ncbi:MAG TPA: ATP synthase F0 subunit B [Pyrinomonadaceae bacterium]|nr:ATP synthase F0 subunit B [Pyrinomonadaceae bacterium]